MSEPTTVTVEAHNADVTCGRCGRREPKKIVEIQSSYRQSMPGPERLVVTSWARPEGWDFLHGLGFSHDLCPACASFVRELVGAEINK